MLFARASTYMLASETLEHLLARAQRFAECLRHRYTRCRRALFHDPAEVVRDLADIDDVNIRLGRKIAEIEHCRRRAIIVGCAEKVGAAHAFDVPLSGCDLR